MIKRFLLAWCLFPLILNAAESTESNPGVWKGEGGLGFTSTSGNSDSENLNAILGITQEIDKWKHSASLRAIQAESDGETSADSLVFKGRSEYELGEKSYVFGKLRYEDDEFSGYDYQTSLAFGVGSRFIENELHLLDASIGLGFRSIKDSVTKDTEDEGIITADLIYEYKISETSTFKETVLVESGDENTHSESDTSLTIRIVGNLAAKISYLVKRNSDVPSGTDKTDEITTVSLLYKF
jgi:putative salt-induced outer membrane protein